MLSRIMCLPRSVALCRTPAPRKPKEADSAKRLKEMVENEKKTAGKVPKETPEELQECEMVFADF